jgi:hypothetical protein
MAARGPIDTTDARRHTVRFVLAACLALAMALSAPALASASTIGASIETLSALSDAVVLVRVASSASRQLPGIGGERGTIVTDVDLVVEQVLKGLRPASYRLTVPGGTVGDLTLAIDEVPGFAPGERCLVFLGASGGLQGGLDSKLTIVGDGVPALSQPLAEVLARVTSGVQGYRIAADVLAVEGSIAAAVSGPVVTAISPQGAPASPTSMVTITGRGFGTSRGSVGFYPYTYTDLQGVVHQIAGTVSLWSDTTITCAVPDYASSGPVVVTAGGAAAAGFPFLAGYSYTGMRALGSSLTYRLNANCLDPVDEAALTAVARASWSGFAGFSFLDGGACATVSYPTVYDGRNDIYWSSAFASGTSVLAYNSYWYSGSTMLESDIVFNDRYLWGDGTGGTYDVASVLAHELGHGLVLGDQYGVGDYSKVMMGRIAPGAQKRALAAEDVAGIRAAYGGSPTLSGTTSFNRGSLYASSTVVPVTSSISGATQMRTFNGSSFTPGIYTYATYAPGASITLPSVDGAYAVKAEFRNASTGDAIVRYATIVLDRVAPVGTMALEHGVSTATTVAVSADSAIDDATPIQMRFSVDGRVTWSAWAPYAAEAALRLPAGNGTKYVYADYRDAAGNTIQKSDTILLAVPVVASTSATVNGIGYASGTTTPWLTSASVTLSVDPPAATIWYRIAGGVTQTCGGAFGTGGDGVRQVDYWSGGAGFTTEPTRSITVRADATAPQTVADIADGADVFGASVTVGLTATDAASGVASTVYSVNGGSEVSGASFSTSTPGLYALSFHSHDVAGNAETPHLVTFRLLRSDSAVPTGLAASPAAAMPGVALGWTDASDNEDGFAVTRADGDAGAWVEVASLPAGTQSWVDALAGIPVEHQWRSTWRYRVRSVTSSGGSPWTEPASIHLAGSAPITSASINGEAVSYGSLTAWLQDASVTLTVDDAAATRHFRIAGGDDTLYATPFAAPGDGTWDISYWSTETTRDPETTHTVTVRVDGTPPVTAANAGLLVSQPALVLTASDAVSGVGATRYTLDGGAEQPYAGPVALTRGVHTVTWYSRDNAGNLEGAHSDTIISGPQAYVRKPASRSSITRGRYLSVSGTLSRARNHSRLTLIAYRWNGAEWVQVRTKAVTIHTPRRGLSRYSGSIRMSSRGAWRVVARYEGDATWVRSFSAARSVTVK